MSQPGQPGQDVPDEVRAAAEEAIKSFSFWNYGMDDVDPSSEYAEWVPALAASIAAAVAPVIRKDERAKVVEEVRAMTLASGLTRRAMVFSIARRIARGTS